MITLTNAPLCIGPWRGQICMQDTFARVALNNGRLKTARSRTCINNNFYIHKVYVIKREAETVRLEAVTSYGHEFITIVPL